VGVVTLGVQFGLDQFRQVNVVVHQKNSAHLCVPMV
jgi:hypothetical protein